MKQAVPSFPPLKVAVAAILIAGAFNFPALGQNQPPATPNPTGTTIGTNTTPANAAVPAGMIREVIPLGYANVESLKEVLPDITSKNGKYIILTLKREIRITDTPQNIQAVKEMVSALAEPPTNVKITVTSRSIGTQRTTGGTVHGTVVTPSGGRVRGGVIINNPTPGNTPGVIRQPTVNGRPIQGPIPTNSGRIIMPRGGVEVGVVNQRGSNSSLNQQFIMVQSGGEGHLEVVREVPMVDFFTRYIAGGTVVGPILIQGPGNFVQTIAPGGTFEVPEFRWEKAGSRLMVKPVVHGEYITVEVVPQITAIVIANPQKFRDKRINTYLTGADQYVSFTGLKTTVTVLNGATVTIGGFTEAPADFNRHFYGFGNTSSASVGSITLKAEIQRAQRTAR